MWASRFSSLLWSSNTSTTSQVRMLCNCRKCSHSWLCHLHPPMLLLSLWSPLSPLCHLFMLQLSLSHFTLIWLHSSSLSFLRPYKPSTVVCNLLYKRLLGNRVGLLSKIRNFRLRYQIFRCSHSSYWPAAVLLEGFSFTINFFTLLPNSLFFKTPTLCFQPLPQISYHPKKSSKDNGLFYFIYNSFIYSCFSPPC